MSDSDHQSQTQHPAPHQNFTEKLTSADGWFGCCAVTAGRAEVAACTGNWHRPAGPALAPGRHQGYLCQHHSLAQGALGGPPGGLRPQRPPPEPPPASQRRVAPEHPLRLFIRACERSPACNIFLSAALNGYTSLGSLGHSDCLKPVNQEFLWCKSVRDAQEVSSRAIQAV